MFVNKVKEVKKPKNEILMQQKKSAYERCLFLISLTIENVIKNKRIEQRDVK